MNKAERSLILRFLSIFFLLVLFSGAQPRKHEEVRTQRLQDLELTARKLREVTLQEDTEAFLELCSPYGLVVGADRELTIEEIKRQFQTKTGLLYCRLFHTSCLRQLSRSDLRDKSIALKQIFKQNEHISYSLEFERELLWNEASNSMVLGKEKVDFARITFGWEGEPTDYGLHRYPTFELRYLNGAWKIDEFSDVP